MNNTLYMVIPCFNEESVLPETSKRLLSKYEKLIADGKISGDSKILFVDDGSTDDTWNLISAYHKMSPLFRGLKLSRNRGHQNALLAGLMTAKEECDMAISMDSDLQDDINSIDEMIDKYLEGCEIVFGVRSSRATDTFFKRFTAEAFYKGMQLLGAEVVFNHADYRLMSKKALDALSEYGEVNLFLRGMVPMLGYKTDIVYYERGERFAGESKYPLKKMVSFALDGVTSLTDRPIKFVLSLGIAVLFASFVSLPIAAIRYATNKESNGVGLILSSIWAATGLSVTATGVVGYYIGKIYMETKGRPRYFIEEIL